MCEIKYQFGVKVKEQLSVLDENNIVTDEMEEWIVKYMDENDDLFINISDLGLTEEDINNPDNFYIVGDDEDLNEDIKTELDTELKADKVLKLYRYVAHPSSGYGLSNVGPNTRPFCRNLVQRSQLSLLTKDSIERLNDANPGFGIRGAATYSVFNWRGGVNCKHVWVKYFFQPSTNSLVKAPNNQQPRQEGAGSVPRYNR